MGSPRVGTSVGGSVLGAGVGTSVGPGVGSVVGREVGEDVAQHRFRSFVYWLQASRVRADEVQSSHCAHVSPLTFKVGSDGGVPSTQIPGQTGGSGPGDEGQPQ